MLRQRGERAIHRPTRVHPVPVFPFLYSSQYAKCIEMRVIKVFIIGIPNLAHLANHELSNRLHPVSETHPDAHCSLEATGCP